MSVIKKNKYVLVCGLHPDTIMREHTIKEKNGISNKGIHCPKCFCLNNYIAVPMERFNK